MPNVGTVSVEDTSSSLALGVGVGTDATTAVWVVTFTSAVFDTTTGYPNLQVTTATPFNPACGCGVFDILPLTKGAAVRPK